MKKAFKKTLAALTAMFMLFSLAGGPLALAAEPTASGESSTVVSGSSDLFQNLINGFANSVSGTTSNATGTIVVNKVDADSASIKLSGAEFTVYQDSNNNGTFDSASDSAVGTMKEKNSSKGEYELAGLPAGTYFIKETKAPTDYELNPDVFKAVLVAKEGVTSVETTTDTDQPSTGSQNTGLPGLQLDNSALTSAIQEALAQIGKTTGDGINNIAGAVNNDLTSLSLNDIIPESTIQNLADSLSTQAKTALKTTVNSLTSFLQAAGVPTKQIMSAISNIIFQVITNAQNIPIVNGLIDISSALVTPILATFIGEAPATAIGDGLKTGLDAGISIASSLVSTVGTPVIDTLINNGFGADIIVPLISDLINRAVDTVTGSNVLDSVADAGISSAYSIADSILKVGGATAAQANQAIAQTVATLIQNPALANGVTGAADTLMNVFNALNPLSNLQIGTDLQSALSTALKTLAGIGSSSGIGSLSGILDLLNGANGTSTTVELDGGAIQIPDKKKAGDIVVEKTDPTTGEPVSGAQFRVFEDTNNNGVFDTSDQPVASLPELNNGYYSGAVKAGTYFIEETKAANGYTRDTNIYKVTVEPVSTSGEVTIPQNADGNNTNTIMTDEKGAGSSTKTDSSATPVVKATSDNDPTAVEPKAQVYTSFPETSDGTVEAVKTDTSDPSAESGSADTSGAVNTQKDDSGEPVVIVDSTPDTGVTIAIPLAMAATMLSGGGLVLVKRKKEE